METTRRNILKAAAALLVEGVVAARHPAFAQQAPPHAGRKVILVTCGGIRREESFSTAGVRHIPHLYQDLLPQGVFYPLIRNSGVTSHFNTISSILTGRWQHLDDWGKTPPASPTLFEYLRKDRNLSQDQAWLISSNKALTSRIGASSVRDYGQPYGANVVFPKQLLIDAVVRAAQQGRAVRSADRASVQPELEAMLESQNYEGLGWSVSGETSSLNPAAQNAMQQAIHDLVSATSVPATGDEFTWLVSAEVMRRFAPSLLVITFSDMEVAHFGSYAMHVAGVRTVDRLVHELWTHAQSLPAYRGNTTLFVLPEFGRDMDGSNTNGFFNHRQNAESTRNTWMLALGQAVPRPQIIEQPVEQIDICPTIASIFDLRLPGLTGSTLSGKALPGLLL